MKLLIPVAAGVEAPVKRQLTQLGYGDCPAVNGRICLEGDWSDVARLNVFLRSGERVLLSLAEFPARTFDELYDGVSRIPWEEYFTSHTRILLDGKCVRSALMAIKAAGGVAKKAIVNRLRERLGTRTLDETGERAIVGVSIADDLATITLDTSGDGLHKRGYRVLSYDAPLRETTAAAMLDLSYFRPEKPFADVFCGSGTLAIEAAMLALGIAPGARREFDFICWKGVPPVLAAAREEAEDLRRRDVVPDIFAGDISPKAISAARFHAERAGVAEHIRFAVADMRDFASAERFGILMSNPPYGERLCRDDDLFALYRDFSAMYRRLPDWSCYFLTSFRGAERAFGRRADKNRKLYNANLECYFYSYLGKKPPRQSSPQEKK